jgi:uncharacterized delta-60 repeat protein
MKSRQMRSHRRFSVERLEDRALLSGGSPGPGSLNPGFGTGGVVTSSPIFGPTSDIGVAIQQQSDGKIVVAGTARGVESQSAFSLARYNSGGSLDTTFGDAGTVFTPFVSGTVAASVSAMAIEPDGKIVVVGTVNGTIDNNSVEEFALARYNPNGSLDTSFGTGGEVLTDFGADSISEATSVAIAATGQIVVAGPATIDGTGNFGVAEYNANGSLDQTFGTGGEATANFGPNGTIILPAVGLALQSNGQIVVAGPVNHGPVTDLGLARFNSNGRLDNGFGTGGLVDTSFGTANFSTVAGVALEPGTGAIVVAGTVDASSTEEVALARYNASNGSLDQSFGTGGEVITPAAPETLSTAAGMAIQPADGAIVVTGMSSGFDRRGNSFQDFITARYRASNGSLDPGFGTGGEVLTTFGNGSSTNGSGVAIQANGEIVAVGFVAFNSGGTVAGFAVARFQSNGNLDPGFETGGEVITNVPGPSSDVAAGEAIQSNGQIVVAGTASVFGPDGSDPGVFEISEDFALTRFNSDGSLDTSFGNDGSVLTDFGGGENQAVGVTIQPDGKILVVGSVDGDIGVARYNPNGSLDTSFGNGGEVLVNFSGGAGAAGLVLQSNGKIVLAGTSSDDFALARLNPNGTLDTSFGTGGEVLTSFGADMAAGATGVALQSNGQIVVVGLIVEPVTFNDEFAVARYTTTGALDKTFGHQGEVTTSFGKNTSAAAKAVAIQSNGEIVVVGTVENANTLTSNFALVRYNTSGKLDNTFGTGGEVTSSFAGSATCVAIQSDGQIVVVGSVPGGIGVARFNADGSLDQGFGEGGLVVTSFGTSPSETANAAGVAITSNGDILVVGTTTDDFQSDFALISLIG